MVKTKDRVKVKTFFGSVGKVEKEVNEFLEKLYDNSTSVEIIDIKQSAAPTTTFDKIDSNILMTLMYKNEEA